MVDDINKKKRSRKTSPSLKNKFNDEVMQEGGAVISVKDEEVQ